MSRVLLASLVAAVCTAGGVKPSPPEAPPSRDAPERAAGQQGPPEGGSVPTADAGGAIASRDGCPGETETVNGFADDDGCPDAVPPDLAAIVGVMSGVVFESDKDIIRVGSRPALDRMVEVLTRYPEVEIEVGVHEDERSGEQAYGRCLTCRRAEAIARYLVAQGIERRRVVSRGYGSSRPIASNKTAEGRQQNRRIEIDLRTAGGGTAPRPVAAECVGRGALRRGSEAPESCYPYVCRAGACLTRCDDRRDCAGAQVPSELATQGWPLECMPSGACTPMDPEKVP